MQFWNDHTFKMLRILYIWIWKEKSVSEVKTMINAIISCSRHQIAVNPYYNFDLTIVYGISFLDRLHHWTSKTIQLCLFFFRELTDKIFRLLVFIVNSNKCLWLFIMMNNNFDKSYAIIYWLYDITMPLSAFERIYHRFIINVNKLYLNGCDANDERKIKQVASDQVCIAPVRTHAVCCPKMRRIAKFLLRLFQLSDRHDYGVEWDAHTIRKKNENAYCLSLKNKRAFKCTRIKNWSCNNHAYAHMFSCCVHCITNQMAHTLVKSSDPIQMLWYQL